MNLKQLRQKRATLISEAEALQRQDGTFVDDAARGAFDAKMAEVEAIDVKIRAAEAAEATPPAADVDQVRAEATKSERARIAAIHSTVRLAKLPDAEKRAQEFINQGLTIDAVRAKIFEHMAGESDAEREVQTTRIEAGEGESEKFRRGAQAWLLTKAGLTETVRAAQKAKPDHAAFKDLTFDAGEFRGMSLLDLAKESLKRGGQSFRGLDKPGLVALALRTGGMQTTSDFTVALENTLHKTLLAAFSVAPDSWRRFCAVGSVSDFRAHNRYRTGFLGSLDTVAEHGEFKNKSLPDATKESITASTKGNILGLSRQAIINDDMGVFSRLSVQLGRSVALSIEKDVYALLALNSGLGPDMGDGDTLFHANHDNIGAGAAITVAALDDDRVLLASQMDPEGNEFLDLRPAVLVLPVGLGGQARVLNQSQYDTDTTASLKPNVVLGLFRDIVDTPRLSGTRRYLFADPSVMPVVEVAFLDGQQEPYMEMQDGWRTDGVEWKVRHDYGVGAIEFRGAVTDAGA